MCSAVRKREQAPRTPHASRDPAAPRAPPVQFVSGERSAAFRLQRSRMVEHLRIWRDAWDFPTLLQPKGRAPFVPAAPAWGQTRPTAAVTEALPSDSGKDRGGFEVGCD